jgi:transposase-like protein
VFVTSSYPQILPNSTPEQALNAWHLFFCPYLIFDARYEKVRHGGLLVDCAVLIAIGIGMDGKRTILGVSVALSEAEVH